MSFTIFGFSSLSAHRRFHQPTTRRFVFTRLPQMSWKRCCCSVVLSKDWKGKLCWAFLLFDNGTCVCSCEQQKTSVRQNNYVCRLNQINLFWQIINILLETKTQLNSNTYNVNFVKKTKWSVSSAAREISHLKGSTWVFFLVCSSVLISVLVVREPNINHNQTIVWNCEEQPELHNNSTEDQRPNLTHPKRIPQNYQPKCRRYAQVCHDSCYPSNYLLVLIPKQTALLLKRGKWIR